MKWKKLCLSVLILLLLSGCERSSRQSEDLEQLGNGEKQLKEYALENEDVVQFVSFTAKQTLADGTELEAISISDGLLTLYLWENGWSTQPLQAGRYSGSMAVIDTAETSIMLYLPQGWDLMENNSRRFVGYGDLCIEEQETGSFSLKICSPMLEEGQVADYTLVKSSEMLLDWEKEGCKDLWKGYANGGDGRWCYDGYYWPSPESYVPSGEDVYYRTPAAYLCRSLVGAGTAYRLAEDLAPCTVDVMIQQQNEEGYFPTPPESQWLFTDYGIPAGFYDTRFNTDLLEAILPAWEAYGWPQFRDALERYVAFYKTFAETHHRETSGGGWMIDDYYHVLERDQSHTSLNHQLAEALIAYRISDALEDQELAQLADRMVRAVEDTAENWIREDHNLHYAFYRDGTYGGDDYPYLTYDDLFKIQQKLEERYGYRSAALDHMMEEKKIWMDANGVTQYRK